MKEKNSKSLWASVVGAHSSVLAFFGIVSCCGMPIIAGALSVLGIGASQLSFFATYKWWFVVLSAVCLIWGFIRIYSKGGGCGCSCGESSQDNRKSGQTAAKVLLWAGAAMTVFVIFYNLSSSTPGNAETQCCPATTVQAESSECCGTATDEDVKIDLENSSASSPCCNPSVPTSTEPQSCCKQQ